MDSLLLYFFSCILIVAALQTILSKHPATGALSLAVSMVSLAGLYFLLGAPFIAGLQLIVYAGAVVVLFVMVLMLFDFNKEIEGDKRSQVLRWGLPAFLFGLVSGVIALMVFSNPSKNEIGKEIFSITEMTMTLFTKYILIFELLGFLLLIVAIGVVTLIRLDRD